MLREDILKKIEFSKELKLILELNLINFKPWVFIVNDKIFEDNYNLLKQAYPHKDLVVFAVRLDMDEKACFDLNENRVIVIHYPSSVAYETREVYDNFWLWFKSMINQFVEFNDDDLYSG